MSGITVAVVGLNFGELWVPIYQSHPEVERVVLCDPAPDVLERVARAHGVPGTHPSLEAVLRAPDVDAVHLLTPLHLHAEQTFAVMGAGKHCAVAVTPSLDPGDLQRIVDLQHSTGLNYMMMETGAYSDPVVHIKSLVDSGEFGDVVFGRGEHHQDMEGWPGYWVGLPPMWYSSHALSPMLAALGSRPTTVRALGAGRLPADERAVWDNPYPMETALYELADSTATLQVTRSMFRTARAPVESFSLYGERHGLEWGRTTDEAPLYFSWGEHGPGGRGRMVEAVPYTPPDLSDTMPPALARGSQLYWGAAPRLVHEFVSSVVEGRRPALDAVVAAQWTAAGFAAHTSAMNGGSVVEIPSFEQ
ncbi:Gfo/Idh/MocA family protein [Streptomyces sp. NPDC056716]|uniref:Gfo/Idh/MocA family protein n=1 Tax=unclassified Streptomyces TaxID=2593676 RepID=UPI0036D1A62B